jgi:DnaJ-class molecular chaperone
MRVLGKGVPALGSQQHVGDLLVKVEVEIPKNLNREQKRLIEKLRNLGI